MHPDNNHIDKKLKQLENQALPDLSRMDEHWKNMQGMLRPETNTPAPKNGHPLKSIRWIIATAFLAGLSYLAYRVIDSTAAGEHPGTKTITSTIESLPVASPPDTIPLAAKTSTGKDTIIKAIIIAGPGHPKKDLTIAPIKITSTREASRPDTMILTGRTSDGKEIVIKATSISTGKQKEKTLTIAPVTIESTRETSTPDTMILTGKTSDGKEIVIKATRQKEKNRTIAPFAIIATPVAPRDTVLLPAKTSDGKTILIKAIVPAPPKPRIIEIKKSAPTVDTNVILPIALKNTPASNARPAAAILAEFFSALEQRPQQFVIDTRYDTIIGGLNGTALLIPANSFTAGGHVTITMKEFYSYEDIITNKLTTASGAQQLVTGGMIHLAATIDGREVNVQPGKAIRWFVPDTSAAISQMQLFNGVSGNSFMVMPSATQINALDTIGATPVPGVISNLETINWVPQNRNFTNTWLETKVKVLDLADAPYKKRKTGRGEVGFFTISDEPRISRAELVTELKEKYGYYKVRIRKRKQTFLSRLTPGFLRKTYELTADVGDSMWVTDAFAKQYRLTATDTITTTRTGFRYIDGNYVKKNFGNINLNTLSDRYSVDISTLGWINCDKFYNDQRQKLNYYIDIKDTAANYYTVLVFDKIRSMMRGVVSGSRVIFYGIPRGESAKVVCVGVRDGKTVAAVTPLPEYGTLINLQFEETTPTAFREGIASMDK